MGVLQAAHGPVLAMGHEKPLKHGHGYQRRWLRRPTRTGQGGGEMLRRFVFSWVELEEHPAGLLGRRVANQLEHIRAPWPHLLFVVLCCGVVEGGLQKVTEKKKKE